MEINISAFISSLFLTQLYVYRSFSPPSVLLSSSPAELRDEEEEEEEDGQTGACDTTRQVLHGANHLHRFVMMNPDTFNSVRWRERERE